MKTVALELQPCCGKRSGVGVYTYELAKRLRDDDQLRFCGNMFNFCGRNDNSAALRGIGMPISESRIFPYGVYRRIWNFLPLNYEQFFPTKADLYIFFNFIVPPRIGGKVLTVVHDMTYMRFSETMDARNRQRLDEGLRRSISRSDRVLTVSDFSKREIHTLMQVPTEIIDVIPNAPSYSAEEDALEETQGRRGLGKPYLLYVGTIEPRKNLVRLLSAFEMLKGQVRLPHKLVLAGGKGWNNAEFDQALSACRYRDDIILTGYVTNAEKNSLYQNADVFVFPSLYEGFGIPPLEAMHFGCPVVCADAASMPEVVGTAAELVDPLDAESIAAGILRVVSDNVRRAELVSLGYAQEKKYTWEASAERLKSVCREVLDKR